MRSLLLFLFCGVLAGTASWVIAQDSPNGQRRPLDLPSGAGGEEEDEEDEPETVTFYGSDYEGDAFFWCMDRSGSMGWGGSITTLKQEASSAIQQLSRRAEFGLVQFNTGYTFFSAIPVQASVASKGAATSWVNSMTATGGTCIGAPAVFTLGLANQSSRRHRQVLMLGDGFPECGGESAASVLTDISSANFNSIPVHTIFISASTSGIQLFQDIAAQNGGTFRNIQ